MYVQNNLGLIESVESMRAQEHRMNQIANNLANVDTNGYKRENITFQEMLFRTAGNWQRVGKGLKIITDHRPGPATMTGEQGDLMINGAGFFKIQTPQGVRYTHDGNFVRNEVGQLVTPDGYQVLGQGGTVEVPAGEYMIDYTGDIRVNGQVINRLDVVTFDDLADIEKEGNNLYRLKDGVLGGERPADEYEVVQGFLEKSNSNSVMELTEMIDLQRAYQGNQKLVQVIDEINNQAISRVGRLSA